MQKRRLQRARVDRAFQRHLHPTALRILVLLNLYLDHDLIEDGDGGVPLGRSRRDSDRVRIGIELSLPLERDEPFKAQPRWEM